jgi:uncharacterized protein with LGFP repeats
MQLTRTRLLGVAATLATIAVAAPVSTAGADTTVPDAVPAAVVTGPTFITSAPATFVNTNTQVSGGATMAGSQVAP